MPTWNPSSLACTGQSGGDWLASASEASWAVPAGYASTLVVIQYSVQGSAMTSISGWTPMGSVYNPATGFYSGLWYRYGPPAGTVNAPWSGTRRFVSNWWQFDGATAADAPYIDSGPVWASNTTASATLPSISTSSAEAWVCGGVDVYTTSTTTRGAASVIGYATEITSTPWSGFNGYWGSRFGGSIQTSPGAAAARTSSSITPTTGRRWIAMQFAVKGKLALVGRRLFLGF